jgi:hypothetical protein
MLVVSAFTPNPVSFLLYSAAFKPVASSQFNSFFFVSV